MAYTAKSVIFDFSDSCGDAYYMGVRQIDFYFESSKISLTAGTDFNAYVTSKFSSDFLPGYVFDTSTNYTGAHTQQQWLSYAYQITNQRLIIVFDSPQTFDSIVVNNSHGSGTTGGINTGRGINNFKIYTSTDAITDTTYNAAISNSNLIFDGQINAHVSSDLQDDQVLSLLGGGDSTSLTDMALDIQAFSGAVGNAKIDIVVGLQTMESCPVDIDTLGVVSKDNKLDLSVGHQAVDAFPVLISLAKETNIDAVMDILLTDGIIIQGMGMDISLGDGNKIESVGLDLMAVTTKPEFKSIYAMHLNSAIKEITS